MSSARAIEHAERKSSFVMAEAPAPPTSERSVS
jgi:hypothetical protein